MHILVDAGKASSQSSLPPHLLADLKKLGLPWDIPKIRLHVLKDTRRI